MASRFGKEDGTEKVTEKQPRYEELPFSLVDTDPNQPRQDFSDSDIRDLAESIQDNTLLQAVTVKEHPEKVGRYIIVAGERRFRAMKMNGKTSATFRVLDGETARRSYLLSAVENLQRVNLNPIEEAECYRRLHDEEKLTWEGVRKLTGTDVAQILNKVKLLDLPPKIIDMVRRGELPQVTALNLSQWRNEEGEFLRMAHDLIAGRNPAAVHFRKETALSNIQVQARLPKTPEDFGVRIVRLSGSVHSLPAVLEAFLGLPKEEQEQAFSSINPSVLGKIKVRFKALSRVVQAFSERMESRKPEFPVRVIKPVRSTRPSEPRPIPISQTSSRPVVVEEPQSLDKVPETTPEVFEDKQPLSLSSFVWITLFTAVMGERRVANLSKSRLERELKTCRQYSGQPVEEVVANAIASAKHRWRKPVSGTPENQDMTRRMHVFFRESQGLTDFEDALDKLVETDQSRDPVELPRY